MKANVDNFVYVSRSFLVSGGCLTFYIVPKDSEMEQEYLTKVRHPLLRP